MKLLFACSLTLLCSVLGLSGRAFAIGQSASVAASQPASASSGVEEAKLAELHSLERRIAQAGGGRVLYLTSLEKREPLRSYYERFTKRVEDIGTAAMPKRDGHSVYGRAVINVSVAPDGRILDLQVVKSDDPLITKSALAVLHTPGVCEPFPEWMATHLNRVVLGANFNYVHGPAVAGKTLR